MMHDFSKWTFSCLGEPGDNHSALCMYNWGSYWKYHDSPLGDHDDQKTGLTINCFCKMFVEIPLSKFFITQILRSNNFTQISLLSQSVVITELMDSLFIFIYIAITLSANKWLFKVKCTLCQPILRWRSSLLVAHCEDHLSHSLRTPEKDSTIAILVPQMETDPGSFM